VLAVNVTPSRIETPEIDTDPPELVSERVPPWTVLLLSSKVPPSTTRAWSVVETVEFKNRSVPAVEKVPVLVTLPETIRSLPLWTWTDSELVRLLIETDWSTVMVASEATSIITEYVLEPELFGTVPPRSQWVGSDQLPDSPIQ
jgi:hypothetical protein